MYDELKCATSTTAGFGTSFFLSYLPPCDEENADTLRCLAIGGAIRSLSSVVADL